MQFSPPSNRTVAMADENQRSWWRRTRRLALAGLGGAAALVGLVLILAPALDGDSFLDFPLGALLAAAGLPVALALLLFRFFARQDDIDRRHGYSED